MLIVMRFHMTSIEFTIVFTLLNTEKIIWNGKFVVYNINTNTQWNDTVVTNNTNESMTGSINW